MEENGCRAWYLNLIFSFEQLLLFFDRLLGYTCSSELGRITAPGSGEGSLKHNGYLGTNIVAMNRPHLLKVGIY